MKNTFLAIVLVTLMSTTPVFASNIDLSSMTVEELQSLQAEVNAEIARKAANDASIVDASIIGEGIYEAGKDIKSTTFTFIGTAEYGTDLFLYKDKVAYEAEDDMLSPYLLTGETATISFDDGMILRLYGSCLITESKPSWAP